MGLTGIETSDIIFGVVEKTKPDFVIAIDALASRSIERVNSTIQISDTGIHPGSGVGNKRKELSKETLGDSGHCYWCANRCRCCFDYKRHD